MNYAPDAIRFQDAGIRVAAMPPQGRDLQLTLPAAEREELAALLGIDAVDRLEVSLHAAKFRGGMRVTGRLLASIVQPSVVSLDPVRQEIDESIDRIFLPAGDKSAGADVNPASGEIFVDPEAEDVPDRFEGPEADMSALIVETIALAIDPYPRAEGESLEDLPLPKSDPDESPFARLESLKKPGD